MKTIYAALVIISFIACSKSNNQNYINPNPAQGTVTNNNPPIGDSIQFGIQYTFGEGTTIDSFLISSKMYYAPAPINPNSGVSVSIPSHLNGTLKVYLTLRSEENTLYVETNASRILIHSGPYIQVNLDKAIEAEDSASFSNISMDSVQLDFHGNF